MIGCKEHLLNLHTRGGAQVSQHWCAIPLRLLPLRAGRGREDCGCNSAPGCKTSTPADTSSYVKLVLADALRRYHPRVDEFSFAMSPSAEEIGALSERMAKYDVVVLGTINATAHPAQARLVQKLIQQETRMVTVALRMPYDLAAYPGAPTYVCTYSILPPAMEALAEALFWAYLFAGALPVTIPGLPKE